MRKALLFAPMILLCIALCGCGETEEQKTRDVQAYYRGLSAVEAETELKCHYDGEVREYTLACAYTPETAEVTVVVPEDLGGIAAVFDGETMSLRYEDILLDAGNYSGTEISPFWAIPSFFAAVSNGYPLEYCVEGELLRVTFEVTDEEGGKTWYAGWFDGENKPVRGEITVGETVVYEMKFTTFTTEEQQDGTAAAEDLGGN